MCLNSMVILALVKAMNAYNLEPTSSVARTIGSCLQEYLRQLRVDIFGKMFPWVIWTSAAKCRSCLVRKSTASQDRTILCTMSHFESIMDPHKSTRTKYLFDHMLFDYPLAYAIMRSPYLESSRTILFLSCVSRPHVSELTHIFTSLECHTFQL